MTLSDSHQRPSPDRDVEATTLAPNGSPPITRITFPTCRAPYPGGSSGCACRSLPRLHGLPLMAGGSASASALSRPAQASLALRPAGSISRPKRPLSRGFSPAGYPTKPLVSYRILSTSIRVDPSSTGNSRRRGALPRTATTGCACSAAKLCTMMDHPSWIHSGI